MVNIKSFLFLLTVVLLLPFSANAIPTTTLYTDGPVYTDGEWWSTNGVEWTLSGDTTGNIGTFTLSADTSLWTESSTGYLAAFSLKNFFADPVELTNLIGPGTWDVSAADINGKGCKDDESDPDAVCLANTGGAPSTDDFFSFTFDITLPVDEIFPDYLHLKVYWVDEDGKKNGDLISQDIAWSVPEPSILALFGLSILGLGLSVRRRRKM